MDESEEQLIIEGEPEPVFEKPKPKTNLDTLKDLFEVPQPGDNDIVTDHLVDLDIERDVMGGDLGDLTNVSKEDIIGRPLAQKRKVRIVQARRRPSGVFLPPPPSMGGMR